MPLDNATVQAIINQVRPQNPVSQLLSSGVGSGAGGGGGMSNGPNPGVGDMISAALRRLTSSAGARPQLGNTPATSPADHIGLSELSGMPATNQFVTDVDRANGVQAPFNPTIDDYAMRTGGGSNPLMMAALRQIGGGDNTAQSVAGDHVGLSELAQGSLLDQIVRELTRGQVPGSKPEMTRGLLPNAIPGYDERNATILPNSGNNMWSRRVTT